MLVAEPKNAQLRGKYGVAQFVSGKVEEAIAEFATAFKDDPTADPPELQMARLWEKRPDAAKADEWYAKAMTAHPKNAQGFREYAGWLMNTGRLDEAKAPLDAATSLEPDARNTLALRGLFARYRRDFPTAEVAFDKMYRESPREPTSSSSTITYWASPFCRAGTMAWAAISAPLGYARPPPDANA